MHRWQRRKLDTPARYQRSAMTVTERRPTGCRVVVHPGGRIDELGELCFKLCQSFTSSGTSTSSVTSLDANLEQPVSN